MEILINIDVPDLDRATHFYTQAFGLTIGRQFGDSGLELRGLPSPIYLLKKEEGSKPFPHASTGRDYARHWSPIHLDIVVPSIEESVQKAMAAGANLENPIRLTKYGKMAILSDPFGNGFCLIEFTGRGYDELI